MSERPFLALRLDAPLMSFGGVAVDERGFTDPQPGKSMITGLLANALGYHHGEFERLQRLQDRLRLAARRDRLGRELVDYQTVDLGQPFLQEGWTTRGERVRRGGGSASTGTHIRHRHYWADSVYTVVLELDPADEEPRLDDLSRALDAPERPLFLGRKPCLPSRPLVVDRVTASGLRQALERVPLDRRAEPEGGAYAAWWPRQGEPEPAGNQGREVPVTDERDWSNQMHAGRRLLWHGRIPAGDLPHEAPADEGEEAPDARG